MGKSSRQKIKKEIMALNAMLDQISLTNIYKTFHPKTAENTFFSSAQSPRYITKQTSINSRTEIFSHYNGMKLEISHRKKTRKKTQIHGY